MQHKQFDIKLHENQGQFPLNLSCFGSDCLKKEADSKVYNLDATDDGESRQKSHGAPYQAELGFRFDLLVPFNLVKSCRVKVDLDNFEGGFWYLDSCEQEFAGDN